MLRNNIYNRINMATTVLNMESVTLSVPKVDMKRLRGIVKAMGWKIQKKNALDEALDEVKNGKILKYDSLDELIKDI